MLVPDTNYFTHLRCLSQDSDSWCGLTLFEDEVEIPEVQGQYTTHLFDTKTQELITQLGERSKTSDQV